MSTALAQIRTMLSNLRQPEYPVPPRAFLLRELEAIEVSLVTETQRLDRGSGLARALLTFAGLGEGATPMQFGQALDPQKEGHHAGSLGGVRLNSLKHNGLVKRAHFGWWVLTEAGREEVKRLSAARSS